MLPYLENLSLEDDYVISNYLRSEEFSVSSTSMNTCSFQGPVLSTSISARNDGLNSVAQNHPMNDGFVTSPGPIQPAEHRKISNDFYIHFENHNDMIWKGHLYKGSERVGKVKLKFDQETNEQRAHVFQWDIVKQWFKMVVKQSPNKFSVKIGEHYYTFCGKGTKNNTIICGNGIVKECSHRFNNMRFDSNKKKVAIKLRINNHIFSGTWK